MTIKVIIVASLVVCLLFGASSAQTGTCKQQTACKCQYDDGTIVDLSGVANIDGTPKYANFSDSDTDLYSWNPCMPFSYTGTGSECINVAACILRPGIPKELIYSLGKQDSAVFTTEGTKLYLSYIEYFDQFNRSLRVELECSDFEFVQPNGPDPTDPNHYEMVFFSPNACAKGPHIIPIADECVQVTPCSCQFKNGTVIDLGTYAHADGSPKFANITVGDSKDLYSWNPCLPFTYPGNHSECVNVAACLIREGVPRELVYSLGHQESAVFSMEENHIFITYHETVDTFNRSLKVQLLCSQFELIQPKGLMPGTTNDYEIVFASPIACAGAPSITPALPADDDLSGGTIFVIILFSLVGAYLVFGMAYQIIVKKENGARIFPNHSFWCGTLPGLVTDGCKCAACKGAADKKYDSI